MAEIQGLNLRRPEKTLGDIHRQPDAVQAWDLISKELPSNRLAVVERLLVRIANRDYFLGPKCWSPSIPTPKEARRMADRLDNLRKGWPPDPRRAESLARFADQLDRMLFYFALPAFRDVLSVLRGVPAPDDFRWRLDRLSRALRQQSKKRAKRQRIPAEIEMELEILRQLDLSGEAGAPRTATTRGLRAAAYTLLQAAYAVSGLKREVTPDSMRKLYEGSAWPSRFIPRPKKPKRH